MDYRQYDSAIGRFNSMDRLSELTYGISPYRFGFKNPVVFSDPSGLSEFENNNQGLALCPTCPNTPEFKPLIDDPNNTYVYDPETNTATQFIELEEVVVQGKPKAKSASDYFGSLEFNYNGLNDILVGGGLTQLQRGYNNHYAFVNRQYYNFYKATKSKLNLPKPGQQRQMLKRLLASSKFSKASKFIKGAGALGAGLTVLNIAADGSDGSLKASSIIDGSLLAGGAVASAVFPPAAPFIALGILGYGIADYIFEVNDTIDANTEEVKIFD